MNLTEQQYEVIEVIYADGRIEQRKVPRTERLRNKK